MKKKFKLNSIAKLAIINCLVCIFLGMILYFCLPYILNYPKNTIDNDFQVKMVGITYTAQYTVLISFLALFICVIFYLSYRKLSIEKIESQKNKIEYITGLRKKCFNYPYIALLICTFVPTIFCGALLVIFHTNFELLMRICIVILSVSSIFSITCYMLDRKFFEEKLITTSDLVDKQLSGIHLAIPKKLIILTFPLFLYSSVLILLLTTSVMTTEKGDLLYHSYKQELVNSFSSQNTYSLEDVKNTLLSFDLNSNEDHIIMFSAKNGDVYYANGDLNDFLIQYTLNYYDEMGGQSFEYYGQNSQAAVIKVHTLDGDYFVGIRFFVFGSNFLLPFFIVAIATILFNIFYIYYIGKSLSNDLENIIKGFHEISSLENIILANNLPITSNDEIGELTLGFNKIQNLTKEHVKQLHDNQNMLMERERLASLGQLIGGIAHNLKTPIMSIAGASEGLSDLIKEYISSVGDPEVTIQDHHDIAKDMTEWIIKIRSYTEYMSDIITAVKGQAVTLSEEQAVSFNLEELIKRVDILMKHELKNALVNLNVSMKTDENTVLNGNINSLVQVINNMISNAIQSYRGEPNKNIDLTIEKLNSSVIISIQDYSTGLPEEVQKKLFKEMITTKGKNGTGLGLFMSYSTVRAHFNGNITFETKENEGTTFHIILPISNVSNVK